MTAVTPKPATVTWSSTPDEEELLVAHLSETARVRFAGEGEEHRFITGQAPSRLLQLGVLPALPEPPAGSSLTPEQAARQFGQAPSNMGVDFRLSPDPAGGAVLGIDASFFLYVQRYPTMEEQAAYHSDESPTSREGDEEDAAPDGAGSNGAGAADAGTMKLLPKYERFAIRLHETAAVAGDRGELVFDATAQILAQLGGALTSKDTVYPFAARKGQTLEAGLLAAGTGPAAEQAFRAAIIKAEGNARDRAHTLQDVALVVSWQPDDGDTVRVQVTLENRTVAPRLADIGGRSRSQARGAERQIPRELALFNAKLAVSDTQGQFQAMPFHAAPQDFRYHDTRSTWALGRSCVARRESGDSGPIISDTWPTYRQLRVKQNTGQNGELLLKFEELADPARMMNALSRVVAGMKLFDAEWQKVLDNWTGDAASKQECDKARDRWRAEMAAFERGVNCLAGDAELTKSFLAANEVFARIGADKGINSWRLFQVCFIVVELTALRARRVDDPELRADLDICDVLWASTGAGKTEGYLGLIITAMFYDRYRGKQRGATALLRYPLRMLSVQQLARVMAAVVAAEDRRQELLAINEPLNGDPFEMGYWAGFSNTPNRLSDQNNDGETTIEWWASTAKANPKLAQDRRIITTCPHVGCHGDLQLTADEKHVRLLYVCTDCGRHAPIHTTDEEVYRACPTVVVCTVDKLARVAWEPEVVNLLAGPAYRCPDHGYFHWHRGGRERTGSGAPKVATYCGVGDRCKLQPSSYQVVGATLDPAPALIIQDELHLLEQELGTFDSHYETLMDLLFQELGSGLKPKMLAATATIEGGESQVLNLYARRIREFPSGGYDRHNSFYQRTDPDAARRLYVGALPNRPDVMEFGARAQGFFATEVARLQADPAAALAELGYNSRDAAWMEQLLLRYELSLSYINRKPHAGRISSVLRKLHTTGQLPFEYQHEILVAGSAGESSLADIANVLDRIENQYNDGTLDEDRLRGLIATSLISHGVDLDRLNVQVMNGMTPTVAGYVQATSRAGRRYTGLVLVGFDGRNQRERSFYSHFLDYHPYIDRLIAPVPVNRFARFAPHATMPGIVSALVTHLFSRRNLEKVGFNAQRQTPALQSQYALRPWWTGPAGTGARLTLRDLAMRALGIGAQATRRLDDGTVTAPEDLFPPVLEQWLEQAAGLEFDRQADILENWAAKGSLPNKLMPKPLVSFRSVDDPMEFRPFGSYTDVEGDLTDPARSARRTTQKRPTAAATPKTGG